MRRARRYAGGGAEEEDAPSLGCGPFAEAVNAVGSGYAFVQAYTGTACGPEHADTVGRTEIGCRQRPARRWDGGARS